MASGGGTWPNDRLETTYLEARSVIESQNETMADVDNKAMQTVRFNTVLIGLLLAAAHATSPSIFEPYSFSVSIIALTFPVFLGLVTYNESDLFVGPSGEYIEELVADATGTPWYEDLLETFAGMISENGSELDRNSWLLTVTQALPVLGIVTAVASVVL